MPNHVHLVAVPPAAASLAGILGPVHLRYAQHVNSSRKLSGRLWPGRYFSCPLDERHCMLAIRYVDRNPVRAGLVPKGRDYPWSSAAGHVGLRNDPLLSKRSEYLNPIEDWEERLNEVEDSQTLDDLRRLTRAGRPVGSDSFARQLEQVCGRILHSRGRGRPRKERGNERG
jgi:putative transposase